MPVLEPQIGAPGNYTAAPEFLKLRRGVDGLLGDISVAKKQHSAPLIVADFLASSYSMMRAAARSGGLDYRQKAPEPRRGQAGLTFLELLPDALRQLKADFEADRREVAAAWWARRRT
jgi:hypothetical protein